MMSDPRYLSLIHDEVVLPSYYLKDNLHSLARGRGSQASKYQN